MEALLQRYKENALFFLLFTFCFWPRRAACGILVPPPGIEACPLHWEHRVLITGPTTREVPRKCFVISRKEHTISRQKNWGRFSEGILSFKELVELQLAEM